MISFLYSLTEREMLMRARTQDANVNPWSPLPDNLMLHRRCEWGLSKKQPKRLPACVLFHTRHADPAKTQEPTPHKHAFKVIFTTRENYKLLIQQSQVMLAFQDKQLMNFFEWLLINFNKKLKVENFLIVWNIIYASNLTQFFSPSISFQNYESIHVMVNAHMGRWLHIEKRRECRERTRGAESNLPTDLEWEGQKHLCVWEKQCAKKGAKYIIYLYWQRETNAYTEIEDTLPSLIHTPFWLKDWIESKKGSFLWKRNKEGSGQRSKESGVVEGGREGEVDRDR